MQISSNVIRQSYKIPSLSIRALSIPCICFKVFEKGYGGKLFFKKFPPVSLILQNNRTSSECIRRCGTSHVPVHRTGSPADPADAAFRGTAYG